MSNSNYPIVVVCSEGSKPSQEIINNIRKIPIDEATEDLGNNLTGYKHHNVTKYYENDIVFLSQNKEPLNALPIDLLNRIEGCIVYFDANNREFLNSLKSYADFMEENNVEFGILLCSEIFDNAADGITYKEAKEYSNVLDVIELDRSRDADDEDEEDDNINHHDPVGYDELLQAIRAVVWSNVDLKRTTNGNVLRQLQNGNDIDRVANGAPAEVATASGPSDSSSRPAAAQGAAGAVDESKLEADLGAFELLLTEVMMFKDTTSNWSRNERLAYAEKFAYAFDDLLSGGTERRSDSDSEGNDDGNVAK